MKQWEAPQWLSDERPYVVVQVAQKLRAPVKARSFECPYTPDGKRSKRIAPEYLHDLLRAALAIQNDPTVHCLIVDDPNDPENVPRVDLIEWVERARERTKNQKPICLCALGSTPCPCGDEPHCLHHLPTHQRQASETFHEKLALSQTFDEHMEAELNGFNSKECQVLRSWASDGDPDKPHLAIRDASLAQKYSLSEKAIQRIRAKLKTLHPNTYTRLAYQRTRAKITRSSEFRD